jgi:hypothetical protein
MPRVATSPGRRQAADEKKSAAKSTAPLNASM